MLSPATPRDCAAVAPGQRPVPPEVAAAAVRFGRLLDRYCAWSRRQERLAEANRTFREDGPPYWADHGGRGGRGTGHVLVEAADRAERGIRRISEDLARGEKRLCRLLRHYGLSGVAAGGRFYLMAPPDVWQEPCEHGAWRVYVWPLATVAGLSVAEGPADA